MILVSRELLIWPKARLLVTLNASARTKGAA